MTNDVLEKIAIEYLNNNISIKDLAASHGISKTTLIRYFNGETNGVHLNMELQTQIDEERKRRFLASKSTSGNKGKFILSKDEIVFFANYYVQNDDVVLEDLAKLRNVSPATFYNAFVADNLGEELYNAVLEKYKLNHKNTFKR